MKTWAPGGCTCCGGALPVTCTPCALPPKDLVHGFQYLIQDEGSGCGPCDPNTLKSCYSPNISIPYNVPLVFVDNCIRVSIGGAAGGTIYGPYWLSAVHTSGDAQEPQGDGIGAFRCGSIFRRSMATCGNDGKWGTFATGRSFLLHMFWWPSQAEAEAAITRNAGACDVIKVSTGDFNTPRSNSMGALSATSCNPVRIVTNGGGTVYDPG